MTIKESVRSCLFFLIAIIKQTEKKRKEMERKTQTKKKIRKEKVNSHEK